MLPTTAPSSLSREGWKRLTPSDIAVKEKEDIILALEVD